MDETITDGACLCGGVRWRFRGKIPDATICNCTACRRYGALWAYDYDGEAITVVDREELLVPFARGTSLSFNFCSRCGNLVSWRGLNSDGDGRTRIAVNLRLAEPDTVAAVPLLRFDGLVTFEDLDPGGRTIADVWF
jgi:Uncharacterized conserved protein